MFRATLKNRDASVQESIEIEFPLPEDQYEKALHTLTGFHIGAALKQDCYVTDICMAGCPTLGRMIDTVANVDELDWLARKLENFGRYELLQFNAAMERFGLSTVGDLIDLSVHSHKLTVISDFSDLELVAKQHCLAVYGCCNPKELDNLDGTETAWLLMSEQQGHVTPYGVVYDNGVKLGQAYDGRHLPPSRLGKNCLMELLIGMQDETDAETFEWVQLPTSQIKLERAMLRAGIPSCGEMQMVLLGSHLPDEVNCALDFEHESIFELNRLCWVCSNFKEQDFKKLGAVCQIAKPACAETIRQLAKNLDQFDFAPDAHTPEELGKYMIQRSGQHEYDESLDEFYNYSDYGVSRMLQEDGIFVDRGYISYHGTLTLEELMRDDPAESYQQEQKAEMEGMAW